MLRALSVVILSSSEQYLGAPSWLSDELLDCYHAKVELQVRSTEPSDGE